MNTDTTFTSSIGPVREGQLENVMGDVDTIRAPNPTSPTCTALVACSKIVVRGDRLLQAIGGVDRAAGPIDLRVVVDTGRPQWRALVVQADRRCLLQEPKGYVAELMIPCTNDDLEECPPLNRPLYSSIPLPDVEGEESEGESQEYESDEESDEAPESPLVLPGDRHPAHTLENPTTAHGGWVVRSPADVVSHPQDTAHGSNAGSKRLLEDNSTDRPHVRRRMDTT